MTSVDREAIGDEIRAILRAHKRFPEGAVYHLGELAARLGSTRPLEEIPEWEEPRVPRRVPSLTWPEGVDTVERLRAHMDGKVPR